MSARSQALTIELATVIVLLPNPLMPDVVRLTHLVETVPYQFLFGWFVVWLFTRGSVRDQAAPAALSTA